MKDGTIRRELGVLSAAIGHWHREHGPLDSVPVVTLPPAPEPKPDWLTRHEAAMMLAGALGWYQTQWCDIATRKVSWKWKRDRESINKHLARFLLMGFYTGTRPGAIMDCQWIANVQGGWVDVDRGVFHRKADSAAVSNKRQPPARLGQRILTHLRRWKRMDEATRDRLAKELGITVLSHMHVVSWRGGGVKDVGNAFAKALQLAGLPAHYTPHIVRHTRATWLMQARVDLWEAAGSLGMSVETLQKVYGHHHPDFQRKAAEV